MARILIIEPDIILADLYLRGLETAGHRVVAVTSAQTAITIADKMTPDIVILEPQLINHSGIEFLYEFRSYPEWQNIPVLILTNIPMAEFSGSHELLVKELGVETYHYKPQTSMTKLLASINQIVPATS